ncbi:UNVERIFIED_CONTAM: hypothetical protein RF653_10075 [Kocuria sp. CPCC 205316]|uniref:hypothetical protein n=1 Tax=Kocuria TaxID=57493 RepID=UPI0036DECBA0
MERSKKQIEIDAALREFHEAEKALHAKETGKNYDRMQRAWEQLWAAEKDHTAVSVRMAFYCMFHDYDSDPILRGLHSHVDHAAEIEIARATSDTELLLQLRECKKKMKVSAGEAYRRAAGRKSAILHVFYERYEAEKNKS